MEAIVKDESRLTKNLTNEIHKVDQAADVSLEDIHRASSDYDKYLLEHKKGLWKQWNLYENIQFCMKTYSSVWKHTVLYENIQFCMKTYKSVWICLN